MNTTSSETSWRSHSAPNQSLWPALPSPLLLLYHRRDRRCAKSDWIYWILSIVLCTRTSRVVMRNTYFIDKYLANIFMNYYCHIIAVGKKSALLKMYSTCHICVIYWLPKISPSYIPYSDHKSGSLEPSSSSVALLVCWHIEAREDYFLDSSPLRGLIFRCDVCSPQSDRIPGASVDVITTLRHPMDIRSTGQDRLMCR